MALLAGCGPRGSVTLVQDKPGVGTEIPILVATTRERVGTVEFAPAGRGDLAHMRYVVSVPNARRPGSVPLGGRRPDPEEHFVTRSAQPLDGRAGFRQAVRQGMAEAPGRRREAVVFVHGFNTTLGDGVFRLAQMVHDLEIESVPVHFAWASAANPLGYVRDRDTALSARAQLIATLDDLAAAGAESVVLVAHSMGAFLAMETMAWMAQAGGHPGFDRLGGVILLAPDIDVTLFRAQAAAIGRLPQPFFVFTNAGDRMLRLSARVTGEQDRLGTLTSPEPVADVSVTLVDVSALEDPGSSHLPALTSPTMIGLLRGARAVDRAFSRDPSARIGLIPGTVVTVRNATTVIVSPVDALVRGVAP